MKHPIDADEADFVAAFYSTLDVLKDPSSPPWNLKAWSESPDVQPLEAARILNGRSPTHKPADEDSHIIEMAALFVAHAGVVPKAFRLSDWVAIADSAELKHDEDIAAYLKFKAQENAAVMAASQQSQDVHSSPKVAPCNSVSDASSTTAVIFNGAIKHLMSVQQSAAQEVERLVPVEIKNWAVKRPQRSTPYGAPLYKFLQAECLSGRPRCPTARDVLDAWSATMPPEIIEVMQGGFKYYASNGDVKTADLAALRSTIARMTERNV